jgi:hypothetical protein
MKAKMFLLKDQMSPARNENNTSKRQKQQFNFEKEVCAEPSKDDGLRMSSNDSISKLTERNL